MDQFQVTPDLQKQREAADQAAYVRALMGDPVPQTPYGSFAEHFAGDVAPLDRMQRNFILDSGNGTGMLNGLVQTGMMKRHQGVYPPAQYPSHYDWKK